MSIKKISIIFAGTPEFAMPALEKINLALKQIKVRLNVVLPNAKVHHKDHGSKLLISQERAAIKLSGAGTISDLMCEVVLKAP